MTNTKHTPGPRMTPAQRHFVERCRSQGPQCSPATSNRASVAARSAWFRTAEACARNGWVTVQRTSATEWVATANATVVPDDDAGFPSNDEGLPRARAAIARAKGETK